eukprot:4219229-Pleurochrysis_carterae.AAC.1
MHTHGGGASHMKGARARASVLVHVRARARTLSVLCLRAMPSRTTSRGACLRSCSTCSRIGVRVAAPLCVCASASRKPSSPTVSA